MRGGVQHGRHDQDAFLAHVHAVEQHVVPDVPDAQAVHVHGSGGHGARDLEFVLAQADHVAVLGDQGALGRAGEGLGEAGVVDLVAGLAVPRQEVLGPREVQDRGEFFLAAVPGGVHPVGGGVVHVHADLVQAVDDEVHGFLVPGDGVAAQDDAVAAAQGDLGVVPEREA